MKAATPRQKAVRDAVRLLVPHAPMADVAAIFENAIGKRLRHMAPHDAVTLSAIARARHAHTDYDAMLADGQDRDVARYLTLEDARDALDDWGARFTIDDAPEEPAPAEAGPGLVAGAR